MHMEELLSFLYHIACLNKLQPTAAAAAAAYAALLAECGQRRAGEEHVARKRWPSFGSVYGLFGVALGLIKV